MAAGSRPLVRLAEWVNTLERRMESEVKKLWELLESISGLCGCPSVTYCPVGASLAWQTHFVTDAHGMHPGPCRSPGLLQIQRPPDPAQLWLSARCIPPQTSRRVISIWIWISH